MIDRPSYSEKLRTYRDKPVIKVLTGLRRSGKSSLLKILQDALVRDGIQSDQIVYINYDNMDYFSIRNAEALNEYLKTKMLKNQRSYVLIDEIQECDGWERVANSLLSQGRSDIYITGSNSKMLSSDLATYIAGRYIEIPVFTLSFAEFLSFRKAYSPDQEMGQREAIQAYIRSGGFPIVHTGNYSDDQKYALVKDIYSSAVLRDVVQRLNIRNVDLLERVLRYVFDNVGNIFSSRNIAAFYKNQQRNVDPSTIYNYLNALEEAFIIKKISRYDIKGKELLQTNEKFYLGDVSLAYAAFGFKDRMISGILENIVLLELERRGYDVCIGKLDDREIDFIAEKQNEKVYVQVAYQIANSEKTLQRELAPMLSVPDQYPKYLVTMDDFLNDNVDGVRMVYLPDFLLQETL